MKKQFFTSAQNNNQDNFAYTLEMYKISFHQVRKMKKEDNSERKTD